MDSPTNHLNEPDEIIVGRRAERDTRCLDPQTEEGPCVAQRSHTAV